jgi:hypothetical protein
VKTKDPLADPYIEDPREIRKAKIKMLSDLIARHNAERVKAAQADPFADIDIRALERRMDRGTIERDLAKVSDEHLQTLYDVYRPGNPGESYMLRYVPEILSEQDRAFNDGDMTVFLR